MKDRAWLTYPLIAAVATAVYYLSGHQSWQYNLIGISSPIAIVIAMRIHRPARRAPWYLFAIGQTFFIAGDVVYYNYAKFFHTSAIPYPSLGDVFYLSVYPCLALGLILMVRWRTPGRDWASFIDSMMIAIGVATLSWVFLISPYWHDDQSGLLTKLTSMAYPVMDLILITVAIRLAFGAGRKAPSFLLMLFATLALFGIDTVYGWSLLHTPYTPGSGLLEIGWIVFYVAFGMAALHPSMGTLTERAPDRSDRFGYARLVLLSCAALIPTVLRLIQLFRHEPVDSGVLSAATIVLFLLVVFRMAGLIRRQERSTRRERALREAGAELVTATNRESIYGAAVDGARSLAGEDTAIRLCVALEDPDEFSVVAAVGGDAQTGGTFPSSVLDDWKKDRLRDRRSYQIRSRESASADGLGLPDDGSIHVSPLFIKEELRGLMIVGQPRPMPRETGEGLEALSSQIALAIESAVLTEELLFQQSEARFASLVKNASDVVTVIEPDTTVRYASPSTSRVLFVEPNELEGMKFADLVHPDDKTRVLSFLTAVGEDDGNTGLIEFRMRRSDDVWIHVETLRTGLLHDPNVKGIVLNTRDVSERKAFEEQLEHQAFHDSVTNLANRALFRDRVTHALERQQRDRRPIAVLFMDLDDFKTINDSLGHAAGDALLREVGERLKETLRAADTAARMGGDEFAVLLEDGGEGVQAAEVADRIMKFLEHPFFLEGKEVFVRGSVGIAVADGEATVGAMGAEELLRNADVAMYMAKEKGKGRYQVFEASMHDEALKRLELKADLQRAVEHGEFELYYQPVIELGNGRISGVEALIRWMHPVRGMIPPLDFIPLAEETGLIVQIGRWVIRQACEYAMDLRGRFPSKEPFHMAVNISARQLQRTEIVEEVAEVLRDTGMDPHSLILEITETVMMQDMELSIERLTALKELGVQLAIDDFGTGYSSLNYVRRFPVDILKVDKSFIDGVADGGESSALTAAVIELAGILNLKPVAEGIERPDQLERLMELNCDLGQGYLFAKPLPSEELAKLLAERRQMEAEAEALAKG